MMKYTTVKNPVFADARHTLIDCIVKFSGFDEEVPFTASASDMEEHSRKIFEDCVAGKYGEIGPYVYDPALDFMASEAEKVSRLAEVSAVTENWRTQLILGIITDEDRKRLTAWMLYAQELQEVTTQRALSEIQWPEVPANVA